MNTGIRQFLKLTALTAVVIALLAFAVSATVGPGPVDIPAEKDFSPIETELLSESSAIAPGQKFTVGIRQKMLPGYHTYWRNPGTLGLATSVKWQLPDGFQPGEIQWPIPQVTKMADYDVWGYEGESLLLVDIIAPRALKAGESVTIGAEVAWLCCGKLCYPDNASLKLRLQVAKSGQLNSILHTQFQRTREQQAREFAAWNLHCTKREDVYHLTILRDENNAAHDPGKIQFFGYERVVSSDHEQKVSIVENGYQLELPEEEYAHESRTQLKGILVAEKGWVANSKSQAMAVDVPILERDISTEVTR